MRRYPSPMEWLPLAHALLTEKLTPRSRKMALRFILTVEFMAWKMYPDPRSWVSCFSAMMLAASMTGFAEESFPKMIPTSFSSRNGWSMCACSKASLAAMKAYSPSSGSPMRSLRCRIPLSTGGDTIPVSADWYPYSILFGSMPMPLFPSRRDCATVSLSVPRQDQMPMPVMTTLLSMLVGGLLLVFRG